MKSKEKKWFQERTKEDVSAIKEERAMCETIQKTFSSEFNIS